MIYVWIAVAVFVILAVILFVEEMIYGRLRRERWRHPHDQ